VMERYRKGEVLGEGTYGKVVKAEEIATGRVVAIKKVLRLRSFALTLLAARDSEREGWSYTPNSVRLCRGGHVRCG
jgi:serine/threonine protein kinase